MTADRLQRSGPRNPCPCCGRTKDADCAFGDEIILCHQGSEARPTDSMRPGDTITINGRLWALIRHDAGFSGCADLLRPHNDRSPKPLTRAERIAHDAAIQKATARLAQQKALFLAAVARVRDHLDPCCLTLEQLDADQAEEDQAWALGTAYARDANALRRYLPTCRTDVQLAARLLKEIGYQRQHTLRFRTTYLGERPWMKTST